MTESTGQPAVARIDVPRLPSGRIQRKMPDPYTRPSISVGTPPEQRRQWRHVLACDLRAGDTVPGVGVVGPVHEDHTGGPQGWNVRVEGGDGKTVVFSATASVFAFVPRGRG